MRKRGKSFSTALACCLVGLTVASFPASAEKADRDKPITITAQRSSEDNKKREAVFEGNVLLTQGSLRIEANRLVVRRDQDGFDHATATGEPARFRQKQDGIDELIEGHAQRIEYDGKEEIVQFFDKAQVKRGQSEVNGNYIQYNSQTEIFQASNPGQKQPAAGNDSGQVRVVIQPKPRNAAPAEQKPPAPSR